MERYYTDVGYITKGMSLNILDTTDGKFRMLIPVSEMPETASAPSTQQKTVLSDEKHTYVEGLQSSEQKTYAFNYHRDNLRVLKQYANKPLTFLERNSDNTGEKFKGTLKFGRNSASTDSLLQGQLFITVNEADEFPLDDVRDLIKPTAIITSPLNDVKIAVGEANEQIIETSPDASVSVSSSSNSIATVAYSNGKLTVTGVAVGTCFINLETSASNEATSKRSIAVDVEPAETYEVSFDANGGTGTMSSVTKTAGSTYELPACTFTAPSSKTFDKWSINGVTKSVGDTITVNADTVVTATWKNAE